MPHFDGARQSAGSARRVGQRGFRARTFQRSQSDWQKIEAWLGRRCAERSRRSCRQRASSQLERFGARRDVCSAISVRQRRHYADCSHGSQLRHSARKPYQCCQEQIRALDLELPITAIKTLDAIGRKHLALPRFNTFLLGVFALLALILTVVGLYGVISYGVTQRLHRKLACTMARSSGRERRFANDSGAGNDVEFGSVCWWVWQVHWR